MHFPRGNINCCWLVITIALLLEFGQICGSTSTLYCFQCSNLVGFNGCPDSSKDIKVWKDLPGKYTEVGVSTSFSCVLGFDASMKLWHQASVSKEQCESQGFKDTLILRINAEATGGNVTCCSKAGCNWNTTTSEKNLSYDEILASNEDSGIIATVAALDWVPILLICIIVVILICCCCCLFCLRKRKQAEAEKEQRDHRQVSLDQYYNKNNKLRPRQDEVPVTPISQRRIDVQPTPTVTPPDYGRKDNERYSAVDRNLYRKKIEPINNDVYRYQDSAYNSGATSAYSGADPVTFYSKDRIGQVSKQVFDNEDFHEANKTTNEELRMPRKGRDWVHIWKSATGEPKHIEKGGESNAFRFNSA